MKQTKLNIKNLKSRVQSFLMFGLLILVLNACVKSQGLTQLDLAREYEEKLEYKSAVRTYEKIFKTSSNKDLVLLSAFRVQEISYLYLKDYKKTRIYLTYVIANANSFSESQESLKRLAYIEHKILNLYEPAIASYHRLLSSNKLDKEEEKTIRLEIARCYYAINNFDEALAELQRISTTDELDDYKMVLMMLKANILQAQRKTPSALETIDKILLLNLTEENRKDVVLNKAIILEHQEKYKEALAALEELPATTGVIESKKTQLKRLSKFQRSRKQ